MTANSNFRQSYLQRLQKLDADGLIRTSRVVDTHGDGTCSIDGSRLVNFGGNDYLNLAHEVSRSQHVRSVFARQVGATASALVIGRSHHHETLETELADFEATESALLFPTGYAANLGVLGGLITSRDAVFCDRDNHASIIDAAKSCDGQMYVYRRDRLDAFENSLERRRTNFERIYIVTDGVFSMDGCVAPLLEICDIAERFGAAVIVDEAHGTGVLGDHGRGATDHREVESRILLRIGTMSKAMGGIGGFAVADRTTIALLRNTARTQFFSTALPPPICVAMSESLRVIQAEPERRQTLAELTAFAHRQIVERGLSTAGVGVAPIIPILAPTGLCVQQLSTNLLDAGFFVPAIRPPTVPEGTSRLRMSLSVQHTVDQIEGVLNLVAR